MWKRLLKWWFVQKLPPVRYSGSEPWLDHRVAHRGGGYKW